MINSDTKNGKYDDIIELPRHISPTRPKMSLIDRAAQFAPFAALTGHSAAIDETARLTDKKIELDNYVKEELNQKLHIIANQIASQIANQIEYRPKITITYFRPDNKKDGGHYISSTDYVIKIDEYGKSVHLASGTHIPIEDITDIVF